MTLNSGQVFHWKNVGDGFCGTMGDVPLYLEQKGEQLLIGSDGEAPADLVARYFSLDHSLAEICGSFPDDAPMRAAREFCRGLRIIRQSKWECLATFICSSMKQVAHIRQISLALRRTLGARRKVGPHTAHTFPEAKRIAQSSEGLLRACALGYRAKNLRASAAFVTSGEANLESWTRLADAELRKNLCALPGVGAKVANCVMLFAYERLRAFPIDVWIERTLREKYFRRRTVTRERLRDFSERYFGDHGGYAQQYLFHYTRMASRKPVVQRRAYIRRTSGFGAR